MTFTVYRFEHPVTKEGPYVGREYNDDTSKVLDELLDPHCYGASHPGIAADCPAFEPGVHIVACESIESLCRWFNTEERRTILKCGWQLVRLTVTNRIPSHSGKQVVVNRHHIVKSEVIIKPSTHKE